MSPIWTCAACQGERRTSSGEPYPRRYRDYGRKATPLCEACAHDADLATARETRRQARAGRVCDGPDCNVTFTPTRADGRYHSNACRQRALRRRRALR